MTDIPHLTLVLGGARSGKTGHAMALTEAAAADRAYIATGQAFDDEMTNRIARHQAERGAGWRTVEAPVDVAQALDSCLLAEAVLLDCMTLWLSNLIHADRDAATETEKLLEVISARPVPVIAVSNEVGLGIVPETSLGRRFRDLQGLLNQTLAAHAGRVEFIAAGLPLRMK